MKRLFPLMLVLGLAACGETPTDAAATSPAPAAETAPAAEPAAEPAIETPAPETTEAAPADAATPPAEGETPAPTTPETPAPVAVADPANAPREGIDYTVLSAPQPTFGQGGIEVAEVFAYTCIHCANLQPRINTWKPTLAADVRFTYVPAAFGGVSDNFARGYFAAEAMGLLEKTHDNAFKAVLVENKFKTGSVEEIADFYASQGADREAFLSTMQSFAVTAKVNRARQFSLRAGVNATPTMIINGKYSALAGDRGIDGLLQTVEWLVARERAAGAAGAAQ
jgi:protein dithiol oxidoreductase (disulfide-forming)